MSVNKLKQRGYAFTIVLNDNGADLFKSASYIKRRFISSNLSIKFIATILHDRDVNEFQQKKVNHYHVVMTINNNLTIGNMINHIIDLFHCNGNQISIEKCSDVCMQVRYLIHRDDSDKYQYMPFDIETNNQELVMTYMAKLVSINDSADIDAVCDSCRFNYREIAKMIGIKEFKKWLWYIQATKRDLCR